MSASHQNTETSPSTEPFNHDMTMEILSRSSLQTVSTFRLLSKEFNALTYESFFRDLHSQRAKLISGFFMQFFDSCNYYSQFVSTTEPSALSLHFLPCPVQIIAMTNIGILLCVNVTPRIPEYYVCKPSTKQYRKLPNPKTRYFTLATGMIVVKSNPLRYKIVRISEPKCCRYDNSNCCNYRTEIFDSETWSWKQLNCVSLPVGEIPVQKQAISVGGSLYWQLTDDKTILSYDQESNCCSVFSLPEEVLENQSIRLIAYEGRLGAVCENGDSIEVWLMKINKNEKVWFRRVLVNSEDVRKEDKYATCLTCCGSDVVGFSGIYKLIFYNLKKKSIDVFKVWRSINVNEIFHFQSDCESVDFYACKR